MSEALSSISRRDILTLREDALILQEIIDLVMLPVLILLAPDIAQLVGRQVTPTELVVDDPSSGGIAVGEEELGGLEMDIMLQANLKTVMSVQ